VFSLAGAGADAVKQCSGHIVSIQKCMEQVSVIKSPLKDDF